MGPGGKPGDSRTLVINRSSGEDASEALRAAEVRFQRFFNNTPIAIAALGRDGAIGTDQRLVPRTLRRHGARGRERLCGAAA